MTKMANHLLALSLALFVPALDAAMDHGGHGNATSGKPSSCNDPEAPVTLECALAPTATFDTAGRLWVAWVLNGHVYLSRSDDKGRTFDTPLLVNRAPERVAADGENRPKVIVGSTGTIFVSWTKRLSKPYSGDIRFAHSNDGGNSFSTPVTVNDNRDITSHRFESMGVNDRGELFLAWLDKRDQVEHGKAGKKYRGAALYYTVSSDGGTSFRANRKIADHTCECCRTAMAFDKAGNPVIAWRHVFENNIRDHAITRLSGFDPGPVQRLSFDEWQIDACPHHGPAIDIDRDGTWHTVWFNNAPERHGLFYAHATAPGTTFSEPFQFGRYDAGAAHPDVLALNDSVYLTWKEFTGTRTEAFVMPSHDGGKTWGQPVMMASTDGTSDHPFLLSDGHQAYLAWHRRGLPYQLMPLPGTYPHDH